MSCFRNLQGFQKQPGTITVEGELESAMGRARVLLAPEAMEDGHDQVRKSTRDVSSCFFLSLSGNPQPRVPI